MSDIRDTLDAQHDSSTDAFSQAMGKVDLPSIMPAQSYSDYLSDVTGVPDPYKNDERIRSLLAQMSDPKAALDEWEAAKAYGRIYNISPYFIYGSSKLFSEDYFGHVVAPKTVPKAVADSFSAGIESMKGWVAASIYALDRIGHSQAGEALGQAFQMGLSGLAGPSVIQSQAQKDAALAIASGGPDAVIAPPAAPASPDMKKFLDYAIASMKKADELNEDIMPRSFGVQALKWAANTLPYMALIGAGSAVGAGLGAGAAGFAGRLGLSLAKRQVLRSVIAGGTSLATGMAAMQGQDFLSLLEAGMDEDTAAWLSLGTGALNTAIEQVIGLEGAVSSMFGKTGIPNLTNAIVKKVWVNGGVPSVIGRVGLRTAMSLITEPTEEGLQALVSDTAQMLGQFLDDVPLTDKSMTVSKMANDIAQNMWQALVTAPLLGLLPNTVQALKDTGRAKAWAAAAPSMPKAKAIELGKATGAFEGIPESEMDSTLGEAYDRLKATSTEVAIARGKAAQEKARELVAAGQKVDRTSSGGFRVEASSGEASGLQEGEAMYTAGAASSDERYGDLVVKDSGDAFTIIDGDIAEGHEGDAVELVNEVAARLGGSKPLLLSDDVVDPVVIEAYNAVVASRGGDGTMGAAVRDTGSAEDVAAKERVRNGVKGLYQLEPEAADLVVGFLEMVADGQGKSFAEVARGLGEDSFVAANDNAKVLGNGNAYGVIKTKANVLEDGTIEAVKSTIYIGNSATFHTLMHEMSHYVRKYALDESSLSALESYYNVRNGKWTRKAEEQFAEDLTSYLYEGKAPEPKLRSIFKKIAAMLRKFWITSLSRAELNPELRKILDSLFTKKEEDSADASGSVASEEVSGDEAVQAGGEISPQGEGSEAGRTSTAVGASGSSPVVLEVQSGSDGSLNLAEGPAKKVAGGKTLTDVEQAILDTAEIDAADQEEGFDGIDRSIGHIAFAKGDDGTTREIYRVASGDIYVAPVSNVIDLDTGNRIGSFAAKAHGLDAVLKIWGLPHKEGEQLTLFQKAPPPDSDAFRKWFGDSKVVDAEGKPLVVYHNSRSSVGSDFAFRPSSDSVNSTTFGDVEVHRTGIFLTNNPDFAKEYGDNAVKAYMAADNPASITRDLVLDFADSIDPMGGDRELWLAAKNSRHDWQLFDDELGRRFVGWLKEQGYDAAVFAEEVETKDGEAIEGTTYVAFDPEQIKSVNNRGTWDASDPRVLYMKAEARPMEAVDDMMEYDDFESWLRSVVVTKDLSDADRTWFKRRWDYLHSGAERKFKKAGDFTRFLAAGSNLIDFMDGLYEAISTGARNTVDRGRKERLSKTISKTPQLTKIMDEYRRRQSPSAKQKSNLLAYVRKNEALVKYLYGEVNGDEAIADEALSDMKAVPELSKREFATNPELTLSDKRKILRDLGNLDLAKKVEANTATFEELLEYTKLVEKTARSLVDNAEGKAKRTKDRSKAREAKLKEYYRARDAARRVRDHMRRLRDFIMRAPGRGAMSYEHYQALAFIRDYLASSGDYAQMALKNLGTLAFTTNPELMQDTVAFLESFKGRPFEKLTMAELSELAQRVKQIAADGRKEYKEAHLAYGLKAQAMRRKALEAVRDTKYRAEIHGEGTEEQKAQEQKMRLLHGINFASIQPPQFVEKYMDGKSGGWNYQKLVVERVAAERKKWENYDRRTRAVSDFIKDKKLHKELFKVVVIEGAGVMGQDLRMTVSELIGVRCLIGTKEKYNQAQREAYIYGNLFSDAEEKDPDGSKYKAEYAKAAAAAEAEGMLLNDYLKAHPIKRGDAWMESQFKGKLDKLLEATSSQKDGGLLTDDQLHLAELMLEATDNKSDFMRFAIAVKNLANREPTKEKYYFPIMRLGVLKDNEDEIVQMLKGGGFEAFQETGMTIDRTNKILPKNQTAVKTDSMRIFFDAIIKQEHLTEMGSYAKEVRAIYLNPEFSKGIKEQLSANLGHGGYDYLKRYIDEITNPMAWKMKDPSGGVVGIARGLMVMSNLAWRLSSFLMQMATSPLPFFFEAPGEMLEVLAEAWTHNPVKWYQSIEEKSGNLKHRQFEPLQIVLEQLSEEGAFGLIKNIGQKGMNPLQFADRFSCAMGWEASYRKKLRELEKTASAKTPQEREEMAKNHADEVVKRTQPSAEDIDRSPLYRDMSAWKQILLQFTQPLNVIWNNVAYDAPMAWKEHHKGNAIGIIAVYAMTGIIVGAVQALRTGGPGDGDDDGETGDDWLKFFLLAACGQFLEMIPLGGDYAVSVLSAAFNEGRMPFRSGQNLALLDEASKSVAAIFKPWGEMGDDERKKALQETGRHVITMTGLATGLPARAGLEYYDFIDRMVNGDE